MTRVSVTAFLALALVVLASSPTHALDPSLAITQYVQNVWRAPGTLPHDNVTSIAQSADGYLWVGTVEGLARFDGVRSVVFDKANTPAFSNNWIRALLADRAGRLWIGTQGGGLVRGDGSGFARVPDLPHDVVTALLEDRDGAVWVGTAGAGVVRFRDGRRDEAPPDALLARARVRSLSQDAAGAVWVGTEDGLFRVEGGAVTRLTLPGVADQSALALATDGQGGMWVGTERSGLRRVTDGRLVEAFATADGLAHPRVWSLATDRDGSLWIGTDGGGLQRLRGGRLETLSTRNGLTNDYVWAIREDREGSLWVATNGGGLNRLKSGAVVSLGTREGLQSDFTWAVRRTADGTLNIGTEDAGLVRWRDGRGTSHVPGSGPGRRQVKTLLERRDGTLLLAGETGVAAWRDGRIVPMALPSLAGSRVNALAEDAAGTLWIATSGAGLQSVSGRDVRVWGASEGMAGDLLVARVARDGAVWAAGIGGLHRLAEGRLRSWSTRDGLPSSYVTAVFEDPSGGAMWAGTRGGLVRIQGDRVTSLTSRQGLADDGIMSAILGADDGIWFGTNRGLFRVGRADAAAVMDGHRAAVSCRAFGLDDGMRSVEVNGAGSSSFLDRDGRLWFATRAGLASIDPRMEARAARPPAVAIEEVLADERVLPPAGEWRLPAGTRRLEIHYTALALRAPAALRFKRRLAGFDADWIDAGARRVADYTNLPAGRYRFEVIAQNADGVWSEAAAAAAFEIAPRAYETLWFRALAVLLALAAGPVFYAARVRHLGRQKLALERLVDARTAELQAASERLAQLSQEDPLTGVANRRQLDDVLDDEWRRADRQRSSLAFLLADVDFFKAYNDRLGHPAGDACLKAVARTVADAHRRAGELVARYGGEEFAVVLPGVSREAARAAAEVLRERVHALGLPHPGSEASPVVTISVGVSWAVPQDSETAASLLAAADRALYAAKSGGRNRVAEAPA